MYPSCCQFLEKKSDWWEKRRISNEFFAFTFNEDPKRHNKGMCMETYFCFVSNDKDNGLVVHWRKTYLISRVPNGGPISRFWSQKITFLAQKNKIGLNIWKYVQSKKFNVYRWAPTLLQKIRQGFGRMNDRSSCWCACSCFPIWFDYFIIHPFWMPLWGPTYN